MSAEDIDMCLDKIYSMNKYLGGKAYESDFRSKKASVFQTLNSEFFNKFKEIKKIQDQRNERKRETDTSIEILRMNNKIKTGVEFMERIIDKMQDNYKAYKKFTNITSEAEEIIFNCQNLLEKVKSIEFYYYEFLKKQEENKNQANLKKKSFQQKLVQFNVEDPMEGDDDNNTSTNPLKKRDKNAPKVDTKGMFANQEKLKNMELNDEEKMALDRWNKMNQQIDDDLDEIENEIDAINDQLENFKENMRKNEILVEYISEEVFKLGNELQTTNAQMKIIIEKFKSAGGLCADVCMSLLLSLFVGLFVYLLRRYMALS